MKNKEITASIIKKTFLTLITITAAICIVFSIGCQKSPRNPSLYSTEIIDGVMHIHNIAPQFSDTPPVKLELLGKIGKLEAEKEEDLLYDPVDVARLPNGDILILERDGCTVKRYSKDHEYVSSFGQKGQGPGDFSYPYCLRMNENKLYVAGSRVSILSLSGDYEGGFKPELIGGSSLHNDYKTSGMAVLSGSHVILPSPPHLWIESGEPKLLSTYDKSGTRIHSFCEVKPYENSFLTLNANIVYFDKDNTDHIYAAYAHQNKVCKYSPEGELLFSADRPLSFEVKNVTKIEIFTSGSKEQEIKWPSVTYVTKAVGIDHKNRLWVLTYLKQPDRYLTFEEGENLTDCYEFDVFDTEGILLFKVPFPNIRFDKLSLCDDRIYLIDSKHESCVYEYGIVETD